MEYNEIIASFEKKEFSPIYLLMGEEAYFIDKLGSYIEDHFFEDEAMKDFNFQLLYGQDVSAGEIAAYSKEYPMMSDYRLLIVREAQSVDKIAQLAEYMKKPQRQTVLVLCYKGKFDGRTEMYKAITKNGVVFDSKKVYEDHLPNHIRNIAKEKKMRIDDAAVNLLATHIGVDLFRIDNELEKLINVIPQGGEITSQIIENYIGISREYNSFELVSAIIARNEKKAYEILNYFSTNPKNFEKTVTISSLYTSFFKLLQYHFSVDKSESYLKSIGVFWKEIKPFMYASSYYSVARIVNIMHLLRKYDLMSKGAFGNNTDEPELLKELTFQIFKT